MRLSILGCGGSRGRFSRPTSFLVDGKLLVDVGTATEVLDVEECAQIDNIIVTHAHIDHVCDLPFLIETIFDFRESPIVLSGIEEVIEDISSHIFNRRIWPDFSRIPNTEDAKLVYRTMEPLKCFNLGIYNIFPIPVNHTVPTVGYIVDDGKSAFAFAADTYSTDLFWEKINAFDRLVAVIIETSFPNRLERLAEMTGHLTPDLLSRELHKLNREDLRIFVTHIKPVYREEVVIELKRVSEKLPINILEDGMEIRL